jgi:hypothetical protein
MRKATPFVSALARKSNRPRLLIHLPPAMCVRSRANAWVRVRVRVRARLGALVREAWNADGRVDGQACEHVRVQTSLRVRVFRMGIVRGRVSPQREASGNVSGRWRNG